MINGSSSIKNLGCFLFNLKQTDMELTKNEQIVALVSSAATAVGAGIVYSVQLVKNKKKNSRKKEIKKRLVELGKIIATNHYMSKESKEAVHEQYELAKELSEL